MSRLKNVCLSLTGVKAPRQVSNIGPFETKKENPNISRRLFPNHCCHFHSLRATFRRGRKMLGLWPQPLSVLCNVPSTSSIPDTQTHSKKNTNNFYLELRILQTVSPLQVASALSLEALARRNPGN